MGPTVDRDATYTVLACFAPFTGPWFSTLARLRHRLVAMVPSESTLRKRERFSIRLLRVPVNAGRCILLRCFLALRLQCAAWADRSPANDGCTDGALAKYPAHGSLLR